MVDGQQLEGAPSKAPGVYEDPTTGWRYSKDGEDLLISRDGSTNAIRVRNWHDGNLGINFNLGSVPPDPPPPNLALVQVTPNSPSHGGAVDLSRNAPLNYLVLGTPWADYIVTNSGDDEIQAGDGSDTVIASAGDDTILAGTSTTLKQAIAVAEQPRDALDDGDFVAASWGDDLVLGGEYRNALMGGAGQDTMVGGSGDDYLSLGAGLDRAIGGEGSDTILGAAGDDLIFGDFNWDPSMPGPDVLPSLYASYHGLDAAPHGADVLDGGEGDDKLWGDQLVRLDPGGALRIDGPLDEAFQGDDYLDGEGGNDQLVGGAKDDTLFGGTGDDTLVGDGQAEWTEEVKLSDGFARCRIDPGSTLTQAGSEDAGRFKVVVFQPCQLILGCRGLPQLL